MFVNQCLPLAGCCCLVFPLSYQGSSSRGLERLPLLSLYRHYLSKHPHNVSLRLLYQPEIVEFLKVDWNRYSV